ncbi:MAG: hypothetical protein QME21_01015 [Anaerolineales bacterium]|nr:hypothetical protein [Anaerolineales bacterium]
MSAVAPLKKKTNDLPESWQRWAAILAAGFVFVLAALEFFRLSPVSGALLGKMSWKWLAAWVVLVAFFAASWGALLAILFQPTRLSSIERRLTAVRQRSGQFTWLIAVVIAAVPPILLLFTSLGNLAGPYLRLAMLIYTAFLVSLCLAEDEQRMVTVSTLLFGLLLAGSLHVLIERLSNITAYPFSLGWSEGNRMFNFSLRVDSSRYDLMHGENLRTGAPGRNFLWGILFLIPGTPIWLHRLWDAFLWTAPYLALGYGIARWTEFDRLSRWSLALWIALFLYQGPIYTPLVLSALLVVLAVKPGRWLPTLIAAPVAGYYAAASRWTWLLASPAWAAMILLADFKWSKGEGWRRTITRLMPVALVTVAGLIGGALANAKLFSPQELKSSTALSQPLLWYRLLPNVNYPQGVLLGLAIAVAPTTVLLSWQALSRRWRLNWVHIAAYLSVCLVFLGGGMVASVKIGGGNNLHNLDMFLLTLAILCGLALRGKSFLEFATWPRWAQSLLALAVVLPAWSAAQIGRPLRLPDREIVQEALKSIQTRVIKAQRRGEVLFMDQRQLLTFGYITDVRLTLDYEKKYMMDKAMAGDAAYFQRFYQDLAQKRFSLIITEPLYDNVQEMSAGFQEENNAWVQWVSRPLLCYYTPVETLAEVRTQMLVPRANPEHCDAILPQGDH